MAKENVLSEPMPTIEKISDIEVLMKFKAMIYPEIKLGDYKNLKAKKEQIKVDPKEIEKEFEGFKRHLVEFEDVTKGEVKMGDTIIMNFKGFQNKEPFPGGEAKDYELHVGSESFIPGFEEALVGQKIGEEKEINVNFPTDYELSPELAGKPVMFEVSVSRIKREVEQTKEQKEKKLQKFGFNSIDHINEEIKDLLYKDKNDKASAKFQDEAITELLAKKETKIDIPEELIASETEARTKIFEQQLSQQQMTIKSYAKAINKKEEDIIKDVVEPEARKRLETTLIINHIAKKEKIEVSDTDIENGIQEQAKFQRIPVEKLKEIIKIDRLVTNLLFDKVIKFLANEK
jgi:trigger factor